MSICGLKKWALLLTFWVALQTRWARATDLTGDNLTLTGTADIAGTTISLGTGASSYPGWQVVYTDGTTSHVDFMGTRSANIWRWWQNGSGTSQLQLTLDNNNKLIIFDQSSTPVPKITLDPMGVSTFANALTVTGTLTVNGTNNQMPNQTLTGANSVLTEGLADGRYLSSSTITVGSASSGGLTGATLSFNEGTATGRSAFAEGRYSTASGYYSIAMGRSSTASGQYSIAIGTATTASGYLSTAMGYMSTAEGFGSTAMGVFTTASGIEATALGGASTASGRASTAMGNGTVASGDSSTAMGNSTTASGDASLALGWATTASGDHSTAIGSLSRAIGMDSTAMGFNTTASGYCSTAMGGTTSATGTFSFAHGSGSTASGYASTVMGISTKAPAYGSLVIGMLNLGLSATGTAPSATSWVPADPLFEIGNGANGTPEVGEMSSNYFYNGSPIYDAYGSQVFNPMGNPAYDASGNPIYDADSNPVYDTQASQIWIVDSPAVPTTQADAFVVYKNGNAVIQGNLTTGGVITAAPGGDIPMFGH